MTTEPQPAGAMVMTLLEAEVSPEQWPDLRAAHHEATAELDPGLVATYLLQDSREAGRWRILSLWESTSALDAMRQAGPPRGPLIFRAAGAEATLSILAIAATAARVVTAVEFVGGPRAGERAERVDLPATIGGVGGEYRRSVRCADDGALRYVWRASRGAPIGPGGPVGRRRAGPRPVGPVSP